jgi:Fe-S cluster biogenesis protein NfuA/nitrite reductase/ring-hydroxylating ferredoxin subunit
MGIPGSPPEAAELLVARVQELQERLENTDASATREIAEELVSCVVQLYGEGLERIMEALYAAGEHGIAIAAGLTGDPLLSTLLLIHDLHPEPLADRVQAALDSVRPYMESHGGNVELLSLHDGVARIHLQGSCSDCSASSVTLELAIKQALEEVAPDLAGLEVEGMPTPITGAALPMAAPALTAPAWVDVDAVGDLAEGALRCVSLSGQSLVVANIGGTLLAYRDACAACGGPLRDGTLVAGALACPTCARTYFLPRAGRSTDDDALQLQPIPLLRELGSVKVALSV